MAEIVFTYHPPEEKKKKQHRSTGQSRAVLTRLYPVTGFDWLNAFCRVPIGRKSKKERARIFHRVMSLKRTADKGTKSVCG